MELDLRRLLRIARRWGWLLLLGPVVAGLAAYGVSSRQQPMYAATTTLLVNPTQGTGALDSDAIRTSQSLALTYRHLITTRVVLDPVVEELRLPNGADELREKVSVDAVGESPILEVTVSDSDPERAAEIANALADQFVAFVTEQAAELGGSARSVLEQQLAETELQLTELDQQIRSLEQAPNAADTNVQAQIALYRTTRNQLQQSYFELLRMIQDMDINEAAAASHVTMVEPAVAPADPYAPPVTLYTLLGAVAGLVVAIGAVALLEYLDTTVEVQTDFVSLSGAPLFTAIGTVPGLRDGKHQLFIKEQPDSLAAEAIRRLRINVEFAGGERKIASLAISSPGPAEGKSVVTANLAVAMAQAGQSVVVIDADLRHPSLHRIFGVDNQHGLRDLLTHSAESWRSVAKSVAVPNLLLVPSGPPPDNPSTLLNSDRLQQLLEEITDSVDIALLDTSPILAVNDPLVVASRVDGVILVCRTGRTQHDALRTAATTLQRGAIRIIGIVLNHQAGRGMGVYPGFVQFPGLQSIGHDHKSKEQAHSPIRIDLAAKEKKL